MSKEASICPKCEAEKALYKLDGAKDESTHISQAGQSEKNILICAKCGARFIQDVKKKLTEVRPIVVPNWIKRRFGNKSIDNATIGF